MKIKRSNTYAVKLYEEPDKISYHNKIYKKELIFTGGDLLRAIVTSGCEMFMWEREEIGIERNK